jgi:cyclopropane fatty-acyl-phospholipid synthase-like methyltransferase
MMLPYRDFYYPLNVFVHILSREEGNVPYLHYGLFDHPGERIAVAQERSTEMLVRRLPPPPARVLEVGIGLGTTMARLLDDGYAVEGITPDEKQIAMVKAAHGEAFPALCTSFEHFHGNGRYDAIIFQESSQYIDSETLFRRARPLIATLGSIVVLDEFVIKPLDRPGSLQSRERFLEAAARHGFALREEVDLSSKAAPTVDYFMERIPRHRQALIGELGLSDEQVEELITSGRDYQARYADGVYGYRLLVLA